jgi:signal transduction histidine kinase
MVTLLRLTSQRSIAEQYFNLCITRDIRIWEWRGLLSSTFKYLNDVNLSFSIINSYHMKYIIIPSVILSIIAILSLDPKLWMTSDVHHFYFEIMAVVLSTVVAFYCITRSYSLNEKFSLFIGIGFLTIAIVDFLHATLSYNAVGNSPFLRYFIPQTWFAGRTFLGAMLAIAVIKYAHIQTASDFDVKVTADLNRDNNRQREKATETSHKSADKLDSTLLFSLVFSVLAISVVAVSFFTVFPDIVTDNPIHRPYEIPSLILFSVALFYFYKKRLYKTNDVFYKGILGALIIDIFGQIIMTYSASNFDTAHNVPHILKISAYFVIVISLAISSIQYNKILREREKIILDQYEKLREADRMKDEFINIAAHELRTPIQPILLLTGILKSKILDIEERKILDITMRNARRLLRITNNILDTAKIESQMLRLNKERANLSDLITNTINDMILDSDIENQNKLRLLDHPKDIFVEVDKTRLSQVIYNLLANSIKFTEKGTISVLLEKCENEAIITIKDSGKGIDGEILHNLFSKFITKSRSGQTGTGLGLFICKNIVEAHGGRIWANDNSANNENGATFTFTLPLSKQYERQEIREK